jgi:hypothetical protein
VINGARLSSDLNGNAAGSMGLVPGAAGELDVRLPAVAMHGFYQLRRDWPLHPLSSAVPYGLFCGVSTI